MPKYSYVCDCGFTKEVIRKAPPANEGIFCDSPTCQLKGLMHRAPSAASSRMVETLDNGLMARRVERPANAEQLYRDRARNSEIDKNKL